MYTQKQKKKVLASHLQQCHHAACMCGHPPCHLLSSTGGQVAQQLPRQLVGSSQRALQQPLQPLTLTEPLAAAAAAATN
jgi:hypothetical protein